MKKSLFVLSSFALILSACTTVPPTNVHQPMSTRPIERAALPQNNGSIYQAGSSRTLFEDRRARYVGDTMNIVIAETTSATTKSDTSASRSNTMKASASALVGLPFDKLADMKVDTASSNAFTGKGQAAANNVFNGNIAVTVIEVLPNGNLLVSGEKQIALGQGTEYIRLSGVVNPYFINAANSINSSNIADARIEYKESGMISEAQIMGWLSRFFLSFMPF